MRNIPLSRALPTLTILALAFFVTGGGQNSADVAKPDVAKPDVAKPETEKNEPKAQAQPEDGPAITLAEAKRTRYQIVAAPDEGGIEAYAAKTLADYLKEMTGAEFPVVSPAEYKADRPAIFVGLSEPALARLGSEPLANLRDQEHVARSIGPDILLYGKGHRASLDAAMEFLENSLGWQWYSVLEKAVVPKRATLTLKPFSRKRGFDFVSRQLSLRFNGAFYLQHGLNMGLETKLLQRQQAVPGYFKSWLLNENFVHTSFSYIPPTPDDRAANGFPWVTKRDYFKTNPEFYSLSHSGKRVTNLQLCYSNRGLRDELTRQVLRHIKIRGQRQLIMIDAFDRPGRFCHCNGCIALEKRYQTPGGPLFDYLFELCNALKPEHPQTRVKTLSYRRSQTQIPPRLPEGEKLPDNLVITFAPIEDCYFADWTHPDPKIQETFQHLKDWAAITAPNNLWAWMYPNPWGTGHEMPVGNVGRVITNMQLMHKAGVRGIFLDHHGINSRSGWSELQAFLVLKLSQDIEADTDALITEFTDHAFGPAAPQMRQYLAELEAARKAMTSLPPRVGYKSFNRDDRTFPYLTPANVHRWQQLFENMEAATASLPVERANVRSQRRELDIATLWKWFELRAAWPGVYTDHRKVAKRVLAANKSKAPSGVAPARSLGDPFIAHFVTLIDAGGEKPLPADFDGIARDRIRSFLPRNGVRGKIKRSVKDPDAAFGTATVVDQPEVPFECGFSEWKPGVPKVVTHGPRLKIQRDQITPGQYRLYPLGEIDLTTDDSMIWFGRSWATNLKIGSQLYFPGEVNHWKAWVSLKFTGPSYGGKGENLVLCDRVILVKSNNDP
jgi:hypothetical protein